MSQQMAGRHANTRALILQYLEEERAGLDTEGGVKTLSRRSTVTISPEYCEGGGSAWRSSTERVNQQRNRRYQKFACVGVALIGALDDRLQLCPAAVMGTGIAGRQVCLFAMVHRHSLAIGHLTIIVQSMAVCRSSHQRTAQIATCRQRLNADEKQQYCCEEDLLRHLPLLSFAKGSDAGSNARSVSNNPRQSDGSIGRFGAAKMQDACSSLAPARILNSFYPVIRLHI
jgi:hypothetical protein